MSLSFRLPGLRALGVGAATSLVVAHPLRADILVVSSTAPSLRPGMQLADGARLEVPAGAKVRVLLPSGATLSVNGPASRPIKEVTKGEPISESVWAKAKELLATGGIDQSRPGATRGSSAGGPAEAQSFAWNVIPAAASGNVCVERGARLALERPHGGRISEVTLIDTAANARATVSWEEKSARADWPAAINPSPDTIYQIVAPGQPMRPIRLRLLSKTDLGDTSALKTLLNNDCRLQARAWLQ